MQFWWSKIWHNANCFSFCIHIVSFYIQVELFKRKSTLYILEVTFLAWIFGDT